MSFIIGSGDVPKLLMGKKTKGYRELWKKFVDENPPNYNSLASPINALRTGALLEFNYQQILDDSYYSQVKKTCDELNVLRVSIDFAKMDKGVIIDFDELKTIFITDFIEVIRPLEKLNHDEQTKYLKSKFKNNYNQAQSQLLATGLMECNLVFLSVENYNDDMNKKRVIIDNDFVKFRIKRDNLVIDLIKERLQIFQSVKNDLES